MSGWTKYTDGSDKLIVTPEGQFIGNTWYADGAYLWRVTWDGYCVKNGTGCIDRAEAERECDALIDACRRGEVDPPWAKSRERQKLEDQLWRSRSKLSSV